MFTNQRQKKHRKKRLLVCILVLIIFGFIIYLLDMFIISGRPLFISPVSDLNIDKVYVEKMLKDNNILFSSVSLSENYYLINIQNNGQVKLSQNKDIDKQIPSLQRILIQLTIEGKPFKSIDFRFSEPIISFD